jgi:Flp pilus assembly pilin Flp
MLLGRDHMRLQQFKAFLADDQGQDLIEYSLLIGVILLASSAILIAGSGSMQGIWSTASSSLVAANAGS